MKNLNMSLFRASIVGVLMFATITSCKKKDENQLNSPNPEVVNILNSGDKEKLIKYLAISLNVATREIVYDEKKSEFIVRDGVYKVSRKDIELSYSSANEYKFSNEQ